MAVLELQVSPSPSSVFLWVFKTEGGLGRTIGKYKNYGFQQVPYCRRLLLKSDCLCSPKSNFQGPFWQYYMSYMP